MPGALVFGQNCDRKTNAPASCFCPVSAAAASRFAAKHKKLPILHGFLNAAVKFPPVSRHAPPAPRSGAGFVRGRQPRKARRGPRFGTEQGLVSTTLFHQRTSPSGNGLAEIALNMRPYVRHLPLYGIALLRRNARHVDRSDRIVARERERNMNALLLLGRRTRFRARVGKNKCAGHALVRLRRVTRRVTSRGSCSRGTPTWRCWPFPPRSSPRAARRASRRCPAAPPPAFCSSR